MQDLLKEAAKGTPGRLAVACAQDEYVLGAVVKASELGIVTPILVGNKTEIVKILEDLHCDGNAFEIVDVEDKTEACMKAAALVRDGKADFLMKGFVDTAVIMRAVLNRERCRVDEVSNVFGRCEASTNHLYLLCRNPGTHDGRLAEAHYLCISHSTRSNVSRPGHNPLFALFESQAKRSTANRPGKRRLARAPHRPWHATFVQLKDRDHAMLGPASTCASLRTPSRNFHVVRNIESPSKIRETRVQDDDWLVNHNVGTVIEPHEASFQMTRLALGIRYQQLRDGSPRRGTVPQFSRTCRSLFTPGSKPPRISRRLVAECEQ